MEETKYILLADIEGEDTSRVCGVTTIEQVAVAWYIGDGHSVYIVPTDSDILSSGYEALDMTAKGEDR